MPAISYSRLNAMDTALLILQRRMVSHIDYTISTDQFVELFIPENLREYAMEVPKHFHVPYRSGAASAKIKLPDYPQMAEFYLTALDWKGQPAPLVPKDPLEFKVDHPHAEGVLRYLESYAGICRQFGLAKKVLEELNERLGSDTQMRFFWPAMLILLENCGEEDISKSADKLRTPKTPKSLPTLPTWLRQACQETSAVIAAASMIPMKPDVPRPVTLSVRQLSAFDYQGETVRCRA